MAFLIRNQGLSMDKRQFLAAAALAGTGFPVASGAQTGGHSAGTAASGPGVLTLGGAIGAVNRGPIDPVRDQLMVKHKVSFEKAHVFDFAAITRLPAVTIKPTLEYDGKPHTLKGPLLTDVVRAAGGPTADGARLMMRAVDGYVAPLTLADARKYRFIVATHLDGAAMPLGGLGPLWAVFEPDRFPEMAAKPVTDRFAGCPWACYYIEVLAG